MTATTDQILQQEQLHFQVLSQRVDNLYIQLNSSINATQQELNIRIDQTKEALRGNIAVVAPTVINAVSGRLDTIINQTKNIVHDVNLKLDTVSANVLADVDKRTAITNALIDTRFTAIGLSNENVIDRLTTLITDKTNADLHSIEDQFRSTNTLIKSVQDVVNNNITAKINTTDAKINNVTTVLNRVIVDKTEAIDKQIKDTENNLSSVINLAGNSSNNPVITPVIQQSGFIDPNILALIFPIFKNIFSNPQGIPSSEEVQSHVLQAIHKMAEKELTTPQVDIFGQLSNIPKAIQSQVDQISTILQRAAKGEYKTLNEFLTDFHKIGVNTDIISGAIQILFLIPNLLAVGKIISEPFVERLTQLTRDQYDLTQLDVGNILSVYRRKFITSETAELKLKQLGYSTKDAEAIGSLANNVFDIDTLVSGVHRGVITYEDAAKKANEIGYNHLQWSEYYAIKQVKPGVNDLIQFAVKEVYSPEISGKFGQYQEFPDEFANRAKLEGLDTTFARQYWAAHWQLPGAQVGYDMLHRKIINTDDLKALLKALDVMPYWRDKLIQLSYNVITRVDARRLHAHGLIDDVKLKSILESGGYAPSDADLLVKFSNAVEDEAENPKKKKLKDLTYSIILEAYADGLLSRQDAANQIKPLGYSDDEINLLLKIEDYKNYKANHKSKKDEHNAKLATLAINAYIKRAISREDLVHTLTKAGYSNLDAQSEANFADEEYKISFKGQIAKEIEKQYFEGLYSDTDVITGLQALDFLPTEALQILSELKTLKQFRTKKPTINQFTRLFKLGKYTEDEYVQILKDEGYADQFIPALLTLAGSEDGL